MESPHVKKVQNFSLLSNQSTERIKNKISIERFHQNLDELKTFENQAGLNRLPPGFENYKVFKATPKKLNFSIVKDTDAGFSSSGACEPVSEFGELERFALKSQIEKMKKEIDDLNQEVRSLKEQKEKFFAAVKTSSRFQDEFWNLRYCDSIKNGQNFKIIKENYHSGLTQKIRDQIHKDLITLELSIRSFIPYYTHSQHPILVNLETFVYSLKRLFKITRALESSSNLFLV